MLIPELSFELSYEMPGSIKEFLIDFFPNVKLLYLECCVKLEKENPYPILHTTLFYTKA